jgi:hypothetical protein
VPERVAKPHHVAVLIHRPSIVLQICVHESQVNEKMETESVGRV